MSEIRNGSFASAVNALLLILHTCYGGIPRSETGNLVYDFARVSVSWLSNEQN